MKFGIILLIKQTPNMLQVKEETVINNDETTVLREFSSVVADTQEYITDPQDQVSYQLIKKLFSFDLPYSVHFAICFFGKLFGKTLLPLFG